MDVTLVLTSPIFPSLWSTEVPLANLMTPKCIFPAGQEEPCSASVTWDIFSSLVGASKACKGRGLVTGKYMGQQDKK